MTTSDLVVKQQNLDMVELFGILMVLLLAEAEAAEEALLVHPLDKLALQLVMEALELAVVVITCMTAAPLREVVVLVMEEY